MNKMFLSIRKKDGKKTLKKDGKKTLIRQLVGQGDVNS